MAETAVAKRDARMETLRAYVSMRASRIDLVVAESARKLLTPKRLWNLFVLAATRQPQLLDCTVESVMRSLEQSAACGLDPSGRGGLAYLVPFKNGKTGKKECTFIAGYKGLRLNMLRSGAVQWAEARVVHIGDDFAYHYGLQPELRHEPKYTGAPNATQEWADITHAYAIARLQDQEQPYFVVLNRGDLEQIRKQSRAKTGPWYDWPGRMSAKSAIRRLANDVPYDPDSVLAKTMEYEESDLPVIGDTDTEEDILSITAELVEGQSASGGQTKVDRMKEVAAKRKAEKEKAQHASSPKPESEPVAPVAPEPEGEPEVPEEILILIPVDDRKLMKHPNEAFAGVMRVELSGASRMVGQHQAHPNEFVCTCDDWNKESPCRHIAKAQGFLMQNKEL